MYDLENICCTKKKIRQRYIVVSYQYGLWELAVHSMELTVCCMNIYVRSYKKSVALAEEG